MEETKEDVVLDHKGLKRYWFKFRKNGETVLLNWPIKKGSSPDKAGREFAEASQACYNKMYRQMGLKYKMTYVFVEAGENV